MIGTLINIIMNLIIIFFLLSGVFFMISGSIGIIRFPDVFTRLHAATKASTLGVAGILIGSSIYLYIEDGIISGKLILAIIFVLLTSPVSGHMISRAAHRNGIKPVLKNRHDEFEEAIQKHTKQH
ncbi:monovalent cation/H(+) antiporter subunit G [Virgibacillus siamensis]|uniref:monovalent cation/H(+) antiporter subunit G n=1 Tax=Virgibacillus siamensis TaxID=480071 RepID=UPI001FEC0E61|nr:monovalent cation/H(+) antiporter subunit G [Virgibacillus siamensis]